MNDINILDESTINKIAAGEVVERPASIVKELAENAMDAGAGVISIEIKGGGIDYIRVTDNGSGIDRDNIKKAFLRHATSKISTASDLSHITSLGFRGEALSSIAAVSETELMTGTKDSMIGYRYGIKGGREMFFDEAGVPEGTTVIVKNLFFNTPARRKFLKSASYEGNRITELVEKLILSHPDVSFKYTAEGRVKLSSSGLNDVAANIYTVFGREIQSRLTEVSFVSENCSISGYVGNPSVARGNRNFEFFFVNGRCVVSPLLSSAVEEAYRPFLMQHRFPFVVLFIDIPPELLDVNVHPSKTEIKFMYGKETYTVVKDTVAEGITKHELIPDAYTEEVRKQDNKPEAEPSPAVPVIPPEPFETERVETFKKEQIQNRSRSVPAAEPVQDTLFKEGFLGEANKHKHRIIGQVFDTYWIIEFESKMYIIDQHAAHEKVLYERICDRIAHDRVTMQLISPPYIVSLTAAQEEIVTEYMEEFSQTGFTIEHFGGREYALSSVPTELFGLAEQDFFLTMLDDFVAGSKVREPKHIKDRIATMACKAAIKGNMKMSVREADALIDELFTLDNPYNCPHGRPTVIAFSRTDLEKLFKRIV